MKTLPKYYCIKRDESNPLWEKLKKKLGHIINITSFKYVGYDGSENWKGWNAWNDIGEFKNNPELITLEFWDECVNGRKIVGYKAPFDMNIWGVQKGDLFKKLKTIEIYEATTGTEPRLASEIVETWEAVYEEEKLEIIDNKYYPATNYSQLTIKGKLTQEIVDKIKEVINE